VTNPSFATGSGLEIQRTAATATMRLEYTGSNAFELSAEVGQNTYNALSSLPHVFEIGSVEKMRLDPNGNLLVGSSAADGDGLSIKPRTSGGGTTTQLLFDRADTATEGYALVFHNNSSLVGSISYTNSATVYNTSSDQRLKENIADADDAGSKIDSIQVRKYDWKVDGSHQDYGMIAQELLEVAPEAVSQGETEDDMMGVDYSKLVPMMLKEIQSLRARINTLEGN
jgi:DNA-binding ferritin-like protein (Dps family)